MQQPNPWDPRNAAVSVAGGKGKEGSGLLDSRDSPTASTASGNSAGSGRAPPTGRPKPPAPPAPPHSNLQSSHL